MNEEEINFLKSHDIVIESEIAKGGFGEIYLLYSSKYNQKFALKKVPIKRFNQAEIDCMKTVDHVNIINLYNYYFFKDYVYLCMEYCPFDLLKILKRDEDINDETLTRYIHDILAAINACHEKNVAHNDIKPSNFLIDKYGRIKVCDFGLSNIYCDHELCSSFKGTMLFMAPEILRKIKFDPIKADIWSLGITFFFMATRTYPFIAANGSLLLKLIDEGNYPIFAVRNPLLRQIISKCLAINPEDRPSISEILQMPYFNSFSGMPGLRKNILTATLSLRQVIVRPRCSCERVIPAKSNTIPVRRFSPSSGKR
ncbi:CAMK family protein kinase [Trichomonas vaginalis G3]|uniref:CAMK family protein kinase n=1 Tax=Trichomonas vaginalis (strain ATCC PRA-98 / G3) TaxID=412133 RepID=A2GE35_TRIV3|nr:protein serine/threonine kinase protein [Trichomonas vaginalis G3]EAX84581.1 CAMK family protein kinase [Trichomonas vaginalis G3]KAI5500419.1 protein serine/threonine kinase protein [Trichomonas vaginalis G3]|eukprot:XP_001297511.1 CAMK family protein kinase [Trichomonas vaginalis G3]